MWREPELSIRMTPERWKRVRELFDSAVDRAPHEVDEFLRTECGEDHELYSQVRHMLVAHIQTGVMDQPPAIPIDTGTPVIPEGQIDERCRSALPMILLPGQALSHFRIVRPLGAGGMGEVYLADDLTLDRPVAIKVLLQNAYSCPEGLQRFRREAKTTSALAHPNVAHIYEIGEAEGICFLVLEYVEGETLRHFAKSGAIELTRFLQFAIELADALAYAHARGIVHRDLKPGNIMVTLSGHAKVLDFGIAKILHNDRTEEIARDSSLTQAGSVMGTVSYMSPEQALGREIDQRSDLFSLGTIYYEMLAGRLPFLGRNTAEIVDNIIHQKPEPLALADPELEAEFSPIVFQCIEKDQNHRYQSASELLEDLKELQRKFIVRASSARRPASRLPSNIRLAVYAALALMILVVFGYFYLSHDPKGAVRVLAVLPLENGTGDPKLDYLARGATQTLINDLSRWPSLRILTYAAVQNFEGKKPELKTIGKALGAQVLLTGTVTERDGVLQVHADLSNAATGAEIWGHDYHRNPQEMVDIEQEISQEVFRILKPRGRALQRYSDTPATAEAYDLYLKGRAGVAQINPASTKDAVAYLRQATLKDPTYAPAFAALSSAYIRLITFGNQPATMLLPEASLAAAKAVALDQDLAEPHANLGFVKALGDYDWDGAEKELKAAFALNPYDADSHRWYAFFVLLPQGREREAMAEIDRALDLAPDWAILTFTKGLMLFFFRHPEEAMRLLEPAVARDPNSLLLHIALGRVYQQMGRTREAMRQLNMPPYRPGGYIQQLDNLTYGWAANKDAKALAPLLAELEQRARQSYVPPYFLAKIYGVLGQNEQAYALLDQAVEDHDFQMFPIKVDPTADVLRSNPRFDSVLRKMRLKK